MQTVRILAIRVDFPSDAMESTTGNGQFDYRTPEQFEQEEGHVIDQAPHDRLYIERHLEAMKAYYDVASFGQLQLTYRVVPNGLQTAYTLPNQMAFYSPDVDFFDPLKVDRLVTFLRDAFVAADQDPSITFADYDAFIVFHAGSDLQHDRLQNSPSDLQTGFLRIGDDRPPIIVDGNKEIREFIMMPETTSQDTNIGALNTSLTHEFGHQLGLPDLYSTFNQAPGVGAFDLMDLESGTVNVGEAGDQIVSGALPAGLGAWSRAFLGWLTPLEVSSDSVDVDLIASWLDGSGVKAVKVPIAPGEYFLIENRQTDLDGDGVAFLNFQNGIIVGPSDANKQPNREYDYLLPGSGVLIWHVDEKVAFGDFNQSGESNWIENALQWDELHRFVDVEEADGIQNLGFTTEAVRAEDLFYTGNNGVFGPSTSPDSRHYSGGNSHVTIRIRSVPALNMRISVAVAHARQGWPMALGGPAGTHAPVLTDVNGDRFLETFMASPDGRLYAWQHDGARLISNTEVVKTVSFTGDTLTGPAAVFAESAGSFFTAPVIADLEGDGTTDIITTDAEQVFVFTPIDADNDGRGDLKPGYPIRLIQPVTGGPIQTQTAVLSAPRLFRLGNGTFGIVVGTSTGGLFAFEPDGTVRFSINISRNIDDRMTVPPTTADLDGDGLDELIVVLASSGGGRIQVVNLSGLTLWTQSTGLLGRSSTPLVADIDGDQSFDVVVVGADGQVNAWTGTGELKRGWPVSLGSEIGGPPAAGDIDEDGLPEIIMSGNNQLFALHGNGTSVGNFPIIIDRVNPIGLIESSPVIGDLDGDRVPEILVGLPNGSIAGYHADGRQVDGFPLGTSGAISSTPALGDLTGNGDIAVIIGSDDAFVHLWTFRGNPDALPWPMLGHDARRSGAATAVTQPPTPGSGDLLASSSVFCYPNPVNGGSAGIRYRLNRNADQVRIRIFTLTGNLVEELSGSAIQNQNEVKWNVSRVVSGIYLCQVEARDATGVQTLFCKIAVVK
jgi:M6 family metalloprotease-like protein